jgi:hypothetical protein
LKDLLPDILSFWPGPLKIHIDAWREVTETDGYSISILSKEHSDVAPKDKQLFFLNLGGYKENEFEEYHYKMLSVADDKVMRSNRQRQPLFINTPVLKVPTHILMISTVWMLMTCTK